MIRSISKELCKVKIPKFTGEIKMLPFNLDNLTEIPKQFRELITKMIEALPIKKGMAYPVIN